MSIKAVLVTAARLRCGMILSGMILKGYSWAAVRDGERWEAMATIPFSNLSRAYVIP